jgi:2-C-methyl-D-erythritol 4-phosphate cytidylyltransferase
VSSIAAILVAAGPGSRLGARVPKAFVGLAGLPLFIRSLRTLLDAPSIGSVAIVVPAAELREAQRLADAHGPWRCAIAVAAGGAQRQDSVRAGLAVVDPAAELIAIHDAARPFASPAVIEAVVAAAARHGAAIAAAPVTDTLKRVDAGGIIETTLPRERMWSAQTPQAFRAALIRDAHRQGAATGGTATDDAVLVERLGARVFVVPSSADNRKITTPEDLRWAEWRLAQAAR